MIYNFPVKPYPHPINIDVTQPIDLDAIVSIGPVEPVSYTGASCGISYAYFTVYTKIGQPFNITHYSGIHLECPQWLIDRLNYERGMLIEAWTQNKNKKEKTLTHSRELPISEIALIVQKSKEFPLRVKIGRGTTTIENEDQATLFSLGVMQAIEAKEQEKDWKYTREVHPQCPQCGGRLIDMVNKHIPEDSSDLPESLRGKGHAYLFTGSKCSYCEDVRGSFTLEQPLGPQVEPIKEQPTVSSNIIDTVKKLAEKFSDEGNLDGNEETTIQQFVIFVEQEMEPS